MSPLQKFLINDCQFRPNSRVKLSAFADAYLPKVSPRSRKWRSLAHVETVLTRMGLAANGTIYGVQLGR